MIHKLGRLFIGLLIAAGIVWYNNRQIEERVNAECQAKHLAFEVQEIRQKEEVRKNVVYQKAEIWSAAALSADAVQQLFDNNIL